MAKNLSKIYISNQKKIERLTAKIVFLGFQRKSLIDENKRIKAMKEVFEK